MWREPQRRTALLLFAFYALLLIYASYYPFAFDSGRFSRAWAGEAPKGWLPWGDSSTGDRIINVLAYVPLGFLLAAVVDAGLTRSAAVALAFGLSMSAFVEFTQHATESRHPNLVDIVCNAGGAFLGGLVWPRLRPLAQYWLGRLHWPHFWSPPGLLLLLWISLHSAPFIAMLEREKIFVPLAGNGVTGLGLLHWVPMWMLFVFVLRTLFVRHPWGWIVSLAAASLAMRYVFRVHQLSWDEVAGLFVAVPLLFVPGARYLAMALAALAAIAPPGLPAPRPYLQWMETVYLAAGAAWLLAARFRKGNS